MEWRADEMTELLLGAGQIAMGYFGNNRAQYKPDASLVTEADIEIENYFVAQLPRCGYERTAFLGEESAQGDRNHWLEAVSGRSALLLDPIDGTANFANHQAMWGISVGYLKDHVLTDGALYFPCSGELWISAADQVLHKRVEAGQVLRENPVQRGRSLPPGKGILSFSQDIFTTYAVTYNGTKHLVCSAVYTLASLLQGHYGGAVLHVNLWDIAGALPLIRRLGIEVYWLDGSRVADDVTTFFGPEDKAAPWRLKAPLYFKHPEFDLYFHWRADNQLIADQHPGEYATTLGAQPR